MGIVRLEVSSRPFQDGKAFGDAGAYEELCGQALFSVDPLHSANSVITDLELAPRAGDGCVSFSADLRILRPIDPSLGNRGVLLDVVNRGSSVFERMIEPGAMGPNTRVTEGFLLRRGYTVVSCGWQHDVPRDFQEDGSPGSGRFGLSAPRALIDWAEIKGTVATAKTIDLVTTVSGPFDGTVAQCAYPAFDVREPTASLTAREDPSGPAELIPRDRWTFKDAYNIEYPDGFQLGKTYELTYTALGAPITGIGFLALRDLVSYLKYSQDWHGRVDFALALGGSQTGRFLRQMVHLGCCADEQGRLVLDGVLAIAAGARMTEANWRFGQPSAQGAKSAVFPFTDATQTDPLTGRTDGLLQRATSSGLVPKVIHLNTSSEYCCSAAITHVSAALSHLNADGTRDVDVPPNVRIYHCASTQHAPFPLPLGPSEVPTGHGVYYPNTNDYKAFVRAAIDNLWTWVTSGTAPPASQYPRLADHTLVERDIVRGQMPRLPGPPLPRRTFQAERSGSSGFDASGTTPSAGTGAGCEAPDLIPAVDADGNEVAGLRHPNVSVPLATYTGWNPRDADESNLLVRATGATIPFARTAAERSGRDDPRASIAERYSSRAAYLERVRAAAQALVAQRYLLAADVDGLVDASAERYDQFMQLESSLPRGTY